MPVLVHAVRACASRCTAATLSVSELGHAAPSCSDRPHTAAQLMGPKAAAARAAPVSRSGVRPRLSEMSALRQVQVRSASCWRLESACNLSKCLSARYSRAALGPGLRPMELSISGQTSRRPRGGGRPRESGPLTGITGMMAELAQKIFQRGPDALPWQALVPDFKGPPRTAGPGRTGWHTTNAAWKRGCAGLLPSSY